MMPIIKKKYKCTSYNLLSIFDKFWKLIKNKIYNAKIATYI